MSRAQLALGVGTRRQMPRDVLNASHYLSEAAEADEDVLAEVGRGHWRWAADARLERDRAIVYALEEFLRWGLS